MKTGIWKGRALKDSVQYGDTSNNNPQIAVTMRLKDGAELIGDVNVFLIFSVDSAPYSMERLRALGWKGNDLTDLTGIDTNEVEVKVWSDVYDGKPQLKSEIIAGGKVVLSKPTDAKTFAARVAAIMGQTGGAVAPGGTKPPF